MFGYVRTLSPELRVREAEFYRGIYCGLCRSMGRCTGCLSRLTLSYDITFLAAVRMALSGEKYTLAPRRCAVHPLRKRIIMDDNDTLAYCAAASAVLYSEKLRDDRSDSGAGKRFLAALASPALSGMVKRGGADDALIKSVAKPLDELYSLERERCDSLDRMADLFGDVLAAVFAHGLGEREGRIAAEIGRNTGRFIYVLDAADDIVDDAQHHRYNPITVMLGEEALKRDDKGKISLSDEISPQLYTAAMLDLSRLSAAAELIDYGGRGELRAVTENIIYLGMPRRAAEVFHTDLGEIGKTE